MLQNRIYKALYRFTGNKSLAFMTPAEKIEYLNKLEANAEVDYKKYPYLPHQDHHSP